MQGYVVFSQRSKLKEQYIGQPGTVIQQLRQSGEVRGCFLLA
jgi:hypothetical protein